MKTNPTLKTFLAAALLLAAAPSGTQAASLLADGDFDSLTDIVAKSADRLETVTGVVNGEGARF